jgi:hypothetical protein
LVFQGDEPDDLDETPLAMLRQTSDQANAAGSASSSLDLTGQHKLVMTFGPGRSGKTLLLRWAVERAHQRLDAAPVTVVTADAARPALKMYFSDVLAPGSQDGAPAFVARLLDRLEKSPRTVVMDFGADMTLLPLLKQIPDLDQTLVKAGVTPVALYLLTPRVIDLTVLDAMEQAGFKPQATALVLNLGSLDEGRDPTTEFAQLRRNSVYRAAIARGAVEIWMPRHFSAKAIEDRRMSLFRAADNEGGAATGLGIFDRSRAWHWLPAMETAFAPIASWLP